MTDKFSTIIVETGSITTIRLNRPEVRNAMNSLMIFELTAVFQRLSSANDVRLIILKGEGKAFCAGADLNYMKDIAGFGNDENYKDAVNLANLFRAVYECSVPTVAVVHGAAFGGANGLLAACDIVIADEKTTFAFSEVKIGISPATIAPFVIKRIGEYNARYLMLTGKRFDGKEAEKTGLVNVSVPASEIEECVSLYIKEFKSSAPLAVRATKKLIHHITNNGYDIKNDIEYTAALIAELRAAEEGQEGMAAFFEKRKPGYGL